MKMIKSISRRTLALILSMLMLLSSGIVGTLAANVELAEVGADTYYLAGDMNSWSTSSLPMKEGVDTNGDTIYYSSTSYSTQYQFKVVRNGSTWLGWEKASSNYYDTSITMYQYGATGNCWPAPDYTYYVVYIPTADKITCVTEVPLSVKHTVTITNTWSGTTNTPTLTVDGDKKTVTSGTALEFEVNDSETFAFTCSSPTHYYVSGLTIDGADYSKDNTYLSNWYTVDYSKTITDDVVIDIVHTHNPFVSVTESANGSIVPSGTGYSSSEGSITYKNNAVGTATANADYYVSKIWAVNDAGTTVAEETNSDSNVKELSLTVESVTENITFKAEFTPITTYTVKFVGYDGTLLKTETVTQGKGATAPDAPTRTGYSFTGWDKDYTNVTEDMTVTAQYTINSYTIKFEDKDGNQIGETQTVEYNQMPSVPDAPVVEGYDFDGWAPIVDVATEDVTYKATYVAKTYTLTVTDSDYADITVAGKNDDGTVTYDNELSVSISNVADTHKFVKWSITTGGTTYEPTTETATVTVKGDVTVEAVIAERVFNTVTINQTGNGTVSSSVGTITDNKLSVEQGTAVTLTFTAEDGYYISNLNGTGNTDETKYEDTVSLTVMSDETVSVTFSPKTVYTVTITNPNTEWGTLSKATQTLYKGESLTITAKPADGYIIGQWVIDGVETGDNSDTYTIGNIQKDTTVSIIWEESKDVTVSARTAPRAAGTVTITSGGTSVTSGSVIEAGTEVTFALGAFDDAIYDFTTWVITGKYTLVSGSLASSDAITIIPTSDITVVAEFEQTARYIYAENQVGWSVVYAYYWGGASNPDYPGALMTAYTTSGSYTVYRLAVPLDATKIKFNANSSSDGYHSGDQILSSDKNYYILNSGWSDELYNVEGLYVNVNGENILLTEKADGTYTATKDFNSDTDITATVTDLKGVDQGCEALTATIPANTRVKFTYNPEIPMLSISQSEIPVELNIFLDNGANDNDLNGTQCIGDTSVEENDSVVDIGSLQNNSRTDYTDTGWYEATVIQGQPVTITSTIRSDFTSKYRVDGFLINGTDYVTARKMSSNTYSATYTFTEDDSVVVPVYLYTSDFLKTESLTEITLYVEMPDDFTGDWNTNYMAAYIWYEDSTGTDYMFGAWPGQVMIPVSGKVDADGNPTYWYTKVTTTSADDRPAAGITFSNYGGWLGTQGVMYPVTNTYNVQVFDYYEFITLAEKKAKNITFVLQNGSGNNSQSGVTEANFNNFVNISDEVTDIFGTVIEETADIGLYVIHDAPKEEDNWGNLAGDYYVKCYLYDANKTYIGECYSYELLNIDELIKNRDTTSNNYDYLSTIAGKRVRIDYEYGHECTGTDGNTAFRYDGQWYDAVLDVTVDVKVALTENDGANYTVSTNDPANTDTYGSAYVEGSVSATVERSSKVTLSATPASGYKFIGWASSNGVIVSKDSGYVADAVDNTTYIAIFQKLAENDFLITHNLYLGGGTGYNPLVLNGTGALYIGVKDADGNDVVAFAQQKSATFTAIENATYTITIGTDADGVDEFIAWYESAVDKFGNTTFEEVGVDNYNGDGTGNLYDNGASVVGRTDMVYFTFEYTVTSGVNQINLFSSIKQVSSQITLIYKYNDRGGDVRTVTVPVELTDEYIAANGLKPTPELIYDNAPYVDDYYKDLTWIIDDDMYDANTYLLWGTQNIPEYTVAFTNSTGSETKTFTGVYNTLVEFNASEIGATSDKGYWFVDDNSNYTYDDGEKIVAYGRYYGFRIIRDINLCYVEDDTIDFGIVIDDPVYTREQEGTKGSSSYVDQVIVDYMTSILVPKFVGDTTAGGTKITTTVFGGETYTNANSPVTLETLTDLHNYKFEYGMILEQLKNETDMSVASGVADLEAYLGGTRYSSDGNRYATVYNATDSVPLTNKNRYLFTITFNNSETNRKKNFNIYGYIKVTDDTGAVSYYFSDVKTLNIEECGTSVPVTGV